MNCYNLFASQILKNMQNAYKYFNTESWFMNMYETKPS